MADVPPYPGAPRWLKVSAIVVGALLLAVVIVMAAGIGGPHGPGRHLPSGNSGGEPPANVAAPAGHVPPAAGHQ